MAVIGESGLYKLILRAQRTNPALATFQDWVTREVLPAIRPLPADRKGRNPDSDPRFVAADVCQMLGMSNPTMALRPLNRDERTLRTFEGRPINFIAGVGLYKLILHASATSPEVARKDLLVDDAMSGLLRVCSVWVHWVQTVRVVPPTKGLETSKALLDAVLMVTRRACKWSNGLLRFGHELVYFGGSQGDVFAPRKNIRVLAVMASLRPHQVTLWDTTQGIVMVMILSRP